MNHGTLLQKKNLSSVWIRIQTNNQSGTENKHFGNKYANIKMAMILKCQENAPIFVFKEKYMRLYLLHRIKEVCTIN